MPMLGENSAGLIQWAPWACFQEEAARPIAVVERQPAAGGADVAGLDSACVERVRAGNREAFREIVDRYASRLFAHLHRAVRHRQEAEDLTQETFLRAFAHLRDYDAARPFRCWLYAIATNAALNALRARHRQGEPVALDELRDVQDAALPAERLDLQQRVEDALDRLPPRTAILVHLHYCEGFSIREAAEMTGTNEGAAKTALCRARKELRQWLIKEDET